MQRSAAPPIVVPLDWRVSPAAVIGAWPADLPLAALVSADPARADSRARWSILAPATSPAPAPHESLRRFEHRPLPDLPFLTGAILAIPYEAGYAIEPGVFPPSAAPGADPITIRVDAALLHDASADRWFAVGLPHAIERLPLDLPARVARRDDALMTDAWRAGPLESLTGRARFTRDVARILERIHAGDVYQVNLAHHLRASFEGSPRALFLRLLDAARPAYAALIEQWGSDASGGRRAILSISPELFLDADLAPRAEGGGRITTRPIKGTRAINPAPPRSGGEDVRLGGKERRMRAAADLLHSQKDAAELAMIVDLMRNDLGRVCEFGSIRVESPRDIESVAGDSLLHAVATISGRLRDGVSIDDLLRAAFPPGSITGAPKIAAMKLIRDLEPAPRGHYCGAIGFVSDHGPARFSVAIRTATIEGAPIAGATDDRIAGSITYPVGAGIVADSDPDAEWEETLAKADAFRLALQPPSIIRFPATRAESLA